MIDTYHNIQIIVFLLAAPLKLQLSNQKTVL